MYLPWKISLCSRSQTEEPLLSKGQNALTILAALDTTFSPCEDTEFSSEATPLPPPPCSGSKQGRGQLLWHTASMQGAYLCNPTVSQQCKMLPMSCVSPRAGDRRDITATHYPKVGSSVFPSLSYSFNKVLKWNCHFPLFSILKESSFFFFFPPHPTPPHLFGFCGPGNRKGIERGMLENEADCHLHLCINISTNTDQLE